MNPKIKNAPASTGDDLYYTWSNNKEKAAVLAKMSAAQDVYMKRMPKRGSIDALFALEGSTRWKDVQPGISVRDGFSQGDYDWFRPDEHTPALQQRVIRQCDVAYRKNPIVNNTVNLMTDLVTQGIRVVCKVKKYEKVYKYWAEKVNMVERSQHFIRNFFALGQAAVYRTTAKVKAKDLKRFQMMTRKRRKTSITASPDIDEIPPEQSLENREIPWEYTFLPAYIVEPLGQQYEYFVGKPNFVVRFDGALQKTINAPNKGKVVTDTLPPFIKKFVDQKLKFITLDPAKFQLISHKKEDWHVFAYPITYPILEDILTYEKMRLADKSALDGATSHIRLWEFGDLEKGIIPGPALISGFEDKLLNQVPNGTTDIIMGPGIKLTESKTDLADFLGPEKYQECKANIYAGLGIPQSLTGGAAGAGGFTNNFVSMKTILERLEYARDVLNRFWKKELKLFQEAMGISIEAEVLYDFLSLSDESAEKALWVQLLDRDVVSVETMRERFGLIPAIEQYRVQREHSQRGTGRVPPKSSPFHDSQPDLSKEKIALQRGIVAPSEVGMGLEDKKPGEKSALDVQLETMKQKMSEKKKGQPGQGRPKNAKDSQKRKQKQVKPRSTVKGTKFIDDIFWGSIAATKINDVMLTPFLKAQKVKSYDDLPANSAIDYERALFGALCVFNEECDISEENIKEVIGAGVYDGAAVEAFDAMLEQNYGGELPPAEEMRRFDGLVYSLLVL